MPRDLSSGGLHRDATDEDFLQEALRLCSLSKDPNTRVGAVIASPFNFVRAVGWNRFPKGLACTPERLQDRDLKNRLIVHAERAAITSAASRGMPVNGCTLYLAATDDTGIVWGGCPCTACTIEIIESGIEKIVSFEPKAVSKWKDDLEFAEGIMAECKIPVTYINPTKMLTRDTI
jgi:dCMP deaminase